MEKYLLISHRAQIGFNQSINQSTNQLFSDKINR